VQSLAEDSVGPRSDSSPSLLFPSEIVLQTDRCILENIQKYRTCIVLSKQINALLKISRNTALAED
jgi:hypothetical protein